MVTSIIGFACCLIRHAADDDGLGIYGFITLLLAGCAMVIGMRDARNLRALHEQMKSLRSLFRRVR